MTKNALGGFLAGTALMYFADPVCGRRRRARLRDRFRACGRDISREVDKAERDSLNRMQGVGAAISSLWKSSDADDPVLIARVRSTIGRAVSHPHAIRARVEGAGRVILEGLILRHEVAYLLKRVSSVPGVHQCVDRLDVHDDAGGFPSLQGGAPRRGVSEFMQRNWTPALRVTASLAAGAMLYRATRSRGPLQWIRAAGGAALMARTIFNRPLQELAGLDGSLDTIAIDKTIHIDAPLEEVYSYWSNFENFPKFMTHLKEVRHLRNGRSHWIAAGPGGISIPWDAEVTEQKANERLAWKSLPGSAVRTAGVVHFDRITDNRTRVQIRMSYCPPGGLLGHSVAWLFGADPKSEMDDDLVRLKSLLETGKTHAHSAPVTREEVKATS